MVVSAATGLFGVGKNVLDVWCNTTFLGEDGERTISCGAVRSSDLLEAARVLTKISDTVSLSPGMTLRLGVAIPDELKTF